MTTAKSATQTAGNGWNPSTLRVEDARAEEALDQVIEDSFPASDAPSHTPTTSLGAPRGAVEEPGQGTRREMATRWAPKLGLATVAAAAVLAPVLWRRHARAGGVEASIDDHGERDGSDPSADKERN